MPGNQKAEPDFFKLNTVIFYDNYYLEPQVQDWHKVSISVPNSKWLRLVDELWSK